MAVVKQARLGSPHHLRARQMGAKVDEIELDQAVEAARSRPSRRQIILRIMIAIQILFLLGFAHMAISIHRKSSQGSAIKELSDSTLPLHVAGHPNGTLVMLHSDNCIYCKKLVPEFEASAKELHKIGDTSLVSVNAATAQAALLQYKVTRFPTLLWFRHGELIKAAPPSVRTLPKILEFVDSSLQLAVIDFASRSDFEEAVPQLRAVLPSGSLPVIVSFELTPTMQDDVQIMAERFRGDTAFLRVNDRRDGDPKLRAYFRNGKYDKVYDNTLSVKEWIESLMGERLAKKLPHA
jgi:thiol-disulfide isomerase/thioredoxin